MDCFHQGIQKAIASQLVPVVIDTVHQIDVLQLFHGDVAPGDIGLAQVLDPVIEDGPVGYSIDRVGGYPLVE